jgi:glucosamine--fructose-6-phosphate aminotransferase (isomerizing)
VSSLGNFPDQFLAEIAGQPPSIRRAAEGLSEQLKALRGLPRLSTSGPPVVLTGMGASYHACYPALNDLAAGGISAVLVDAAELLHFRRGIIQRGTLVVAVSQSGESAELVALGEELRRLPSRPTLVSVTNGVVNTLAGVADVALDSRAGRETGPSTMTFCASLVVLSNLVRVLAGATPRAAVDRTLAAAEAAAAGCELLLVEPEARAQELAEWHRGRDAVVLLGRGPARAASEMGALLLKESAALPAESLEAAQFRHGPLELAGPDLAAIVVATEPEVLRFDLRMSADLVEAGAAVLVVSREGDAPGGAKAVATGRIDRSLLPAISVVPSQLLSWALAVKRGRTPGVLTRAMKVTTRA